MGDAPGRGGAQRRHLNERGWSEKYELKPEGPTSMGSLSYREDLEEEKNTAFTWEVKANSRAHNSQFKKKSFLCWQRQKYKSNVIYTAKYNVFSFLPLNLCGQFCRISNLYFLFIIILQGFPEISTLPWFSLFAPLMGLLIIRATRDLVDDIGRHRSDRIVNNRPCQILVGKSFLWKKWANLRVGDLVCLHRDNIVPADLLLLASTEPSSLCYVETADIDGETNLKFRQAPLVTHLELTNIRNMASFQGKVVCEEPNSRMHHFVGCLEWGGRKHPLDSGNVLLRGCRVRNTDTCYGMVIYAGFDTKIMKNCGKIHLKRTKIDHLINRLVMLIFVSLVLISLALSFGFWFKVKEFKAKHHYVPSKDLHSVATETFLIFWGFLILLSVMVPMAMFIMVEFIYLGNSMFINWDVHMYSAPRDEPAKARSTSLNDQLGQVEYIFSDKTGTLTQNVMTFKKCCIGGVIYGGSPAPCSAQESALPPGRRPLSSHLPHGGTGLFFGFSQTNLPRGHSPAFPGVTREVFLGFLPVVWKPESHCQLRDQEQWWAGPHPSLSSCGCLLASFAEGRAEAGGPWLLGVSGPEPQAQLVRCPDEEEETPRKENPYLWNKFADGKFLYRNAKLMCAVRDNEDKMVREFWRLLAICHTVMVQEKDNQLVYQAASPDEEALVTAARNFGYVFLARTQDSITVMELGEERVYQVLAMMDFNSIRKRMSVLVRNPEGSIYLYTKGADVVIFERLRKKGMKEWTTEEALASFAEQTLRTLCLAYKEVDEDVYQEWCQRHQEAGILLQNRAHALHQVYEEMEQGLQLLGVTAIEDRLQDGVCDTIKCLKQGSIKVWVLTGDKQETAVNIGFACHLLSESMLILEEKEIVRILEAYWETSNNVRGGEGRRKKRFLPQVKMAMVISGEFLDQLLLSLRKEPRALVHKVNRDADESWQEPDEQRTDFLRARRISLLWRTLGIQLRSTGLAPQVTDSNTSESPDVRRERAFVELASQCQAVICCRVTPKQKALIVALVKKYQRVVTLAIGDGANDVNMIKTADIGVGLAGQEGTQAVQNSDYVLAQFCFLKRLLLVHGRWAYMRVCKFLRYFIYKTVACMMVQIWFAFYSGFSAQPLYEGWFLALFNLFYSTLPVLYIGLFEQDVSAERSLELPELYIAGQKDELFNYWVFLQALAHGTVTSLVNFFVTLWVSHDLAGPVSFSDYQSFAVVVAMSSLLSITMEVILIIRYWTVLSVLAIFLSLCFYVVATWASQSFWLFQISPKNFPFLYADRNVLSHPSILLVVLLNVSLNTLPTLALRVICQALKKAGPKQEEEAPSEEMIPGEPGRYLHRGSRGRRSSYAFSHREGYADLITQGTILRKAPGVSSDMLADQTIPSEEELSPGMQESFRFSRKLSLLGKKRHQHQGKAASGETSPVCAVSSTATAGRPCSSVQRPAAPENWPSGSLREPLPSGSAAQPWGQPSGQSQPAPPEDKRAAWRAALRSWRSRPCGRQKWQQPPAEGTAPPRSQALPAVGPPAPPAPGASSADAPSRPGRRLWSL
ncbi:phospholipid-transporting ATPase IK [Mirounga leonina]|uniref:phospholipid-transporting ATPase IK n=1 Tax=Mirounga leonina TaxID=9715 RepID=UPI00156C523A|nr:phospholipid-transporting ATPase IK [Mirounga leonina]